MAIDVFFRNQIRAAILSTAVSMLSAANAHGGGNVEYCRGVMDNARANALSFGLDPVEIEGQVRALCKPGYMIEGGTE